MALVAGELSAIAPDGPEFPTQYRRTILCGWAIIAICFGSLVLWSALAPLGSAVIAAGTVVVDSARKSVQHLEGGIIRQILVRDGDIVEPQARVISNAAAPFDTSHAVGASVLLTP